MQIHRHAIDQHRHVLGEAGVEPGPHLRELAHRSGRHQRLDRRHVLRRVDEQIDIAARPERRIGVHVVGQRHALEHDAGDAALGQAIDDVEHGPFQAQDVLHLRPMGAGERVELVGPQLEGAVPPRLDEEPVQALGADLSVERTEQLVGQRTVVAAGQRGTRARRPVGPAAWRRRHRS